MPQRRQPKRTRAAVEKRVGKLLEACHKALLAGSYGKAQDLARKALQLNAACVAAHPLVYKFDLLHRLEEQAPRLEIRRVGFEERMPDLEGVAADRSTDAAAFLRDVLDAFCGGACLDIDCSTTDGFRAQCGLQAGGVELKLIVTDGGPSSAVLHLLPGADGEPWNAPTQADQRNGEWIPPVIEDGEGPPPLPPLPPVPADEGETDLPGVDR